MKNNENGHVLLDIILTIVLLAISLPALVQLYTTVAVDSTIFELQARALYLGEQKIEQVTMDKFSPSRGYLYVTTPGRYPTETLSGNFTRAVVVTPSLVFNGVTYASVVVTVTRSGMPPITLTTWITRH